MSGIALPEVWRERLESLAGRRRETLVVGAIVGLAVFSSLGMWARGAPAIIAPPARATPTPSTFSAVGGIVVHVAGAVRRPGIIQLPPGARVADALEMAGGPLPRADLDLLNLAALAVDGTQILVPFRGSAAPAASVASPAATAGGVVALNSADASVLETVPGLGPVKAGAIVAYRTEIGGFTSIDQLLEVSGIGPATLESIRPFVSL